MMIFLINRLALTIVNLKQPDTFIRACLCINYLKIEKTRSSELPYKIQQSLNQLPYLSLSVGKKQFLDQNLISS